MDDKRRQLCLLCGVRLDKLDEGYTNGFDSRHSNLETCLANLVRQIQGLQDRLDEVEEKVYRG